MINIYAENFAEKVKDTLKHYCMSDRELAAMTGIQETRLMKGVYKPYSFELRARVREVIEEAEVGLL